MKRSRIKERLYYNEMLQNQRASILRWSSPESKSTQSYLAVSWPLTQNPTKEKQMTIQLTLRNSVHTSTCHAIPNLYLFARLLRYSIHNKPKKYFPYKESNQENVLVFHRSKYKKKLYQEIFQSLFLKEINMTPFI